MATWKQAETDLRNLSAVAVKKKGLKNQKSRGLRNPKKKKRNNQKQGSGRGDAVNEAKGHREAGTEEQSHARRVVCIAGGLLILFLFVEGGTKRWKAEGDGWNTGTLKVIETLKFSVR